MSIDPARAAGLLLVLIIVLVLERSSRLRAQSRAGARSISAATRACLAHETELMARAKSETVAVLGASPKPDRYAYRAMQMLREYGHRAVPVNPAFPEILGEACYAKLADVPDRVDTITVYLGKQRSDPLIDEILAAKPKRIIMNPGAENDDLARKAEAAGIEPVYDCTLVMLQMGNF